VSDQHCISDDASVATQETADDREVSYGTINNSCCATNYGQTACRTSEEARDRGDDSADQGTERVTGATKDTAEDATSETASDSTQSTTIQKSTNPGEVASDATKTAAT